MNNARVLLQQGCGPCRPLLAAVRPHHLAYCRRHGFRYVPITTRPWHAQYELERDKLLLLSWALSHLVAEGGLLVCLDADAVIVGDEDLGDALPAGADFGMVLATGRFFNTGAWWIRHTPNAAAAIEALADMPPRPPGVTYGDQQRLVDALPRLADAGLQASALDSRWNWYDNAARRPTPPVQVRAWHSPVTPAPAKLLAMKGAIHAARV